MVFVQGLVGNTGPAVLKPVGRGVGGALHIPALEVAQFVLDAPLVAAPANIKIVQATSRILGLARNGPTTTLILFGEPGDKGVLTLALGDTLKTDQRRLSHRQASPVDREPWPAIRCESFPCRTSFPTGLGSSAPRARSRSWWGRNSSASSPAKMASRR